MSTWQEVDGDNTLALEWPIDKHALVWEIGGFTGRWAGQMIEKYHPMMHIFEPQLWLVKSLAEKYLGTPGVSIHAIGLWTHHAYLPLWEHDTDGASVVRNDGRKSVVCEFHDIYDFLNATPVDVCLMNIEGSEYVLLPYLLGLGMMDHFRFFWCQFHPGMVQFGEEKYSRIYDGMSKTHRVLWDYYPTAVAWERK